MNSPVSTWTEATAPLWRHNVALARLLGLCPLLAVTTTLVNGLALGLATAVIVVVTSTTMSALRAVVHPSARLLLSLLILATLVTTLDLVAEALLYDLHERLGLFVPLIVVNSGLLAHAESVASRRGVVFTFLSAVTTGLGFLFALVALGALREILGSGTVLADIELLFGDGARTLALDLPFDGMHVALLPPGAFFGMGLLLALRNRLGGRADPSGDAREAPR